MSDQEVMSSTEYYNDLAEKYKVNKRKAIENVLLAGRILTECREHLSHGQFLEWLADYRVSESLRTSQRLLSIYSDFGHLLDSEDKLGTIDGLGVTSLLELKKLPERFRKDIEVVIKDGDEEKHVVKSVIDEEKLGDFLDTTVEFEGKPTKVKDLPASELNKQIKIAQGVYEPESWGDRNDEYREKVIDSDNTGSKAVIDDKSSVRQVVSMLSGVLDDFNLLLPEFDHIGDNVILECSDKELQEIRGVSKRFLSQFEAVYLKVKTLQGKIDG